jgi:hypothetical protein
LGFAASLGSADILKAGRGLAFLSVLLGTDLTTYSSARSGFQSAEKVGVTNKAYLSG